MIFFRLFLYWILSLSNVQWIVLCFKRQFQKFNTWILIMAKNSFLRSEPIDFYIRTYIWMTVFFARQRQCVYFKSRFESNYIFSLLIMESMSSDIWKDQPLYKAIFYKKMPNIIFHSRFKFTNRIIHVNVYANVNGPNQDLPVDDT